MALLDVDSASFRAVWHPQTVKPLASSGTPPRPTREVWADAVRGLSILLVVLMHAALPHDSLRDMMAVLVPVRMPAFFFVSGLFASRSLRLDWKPFFNTRLLHFAWLFAVWFTVMTALHLILHPESLPTGLAGWVDFLKRPANPWWFLTALGVTYFAARCLRALPLPLQLALALAVSVVAFGGAPWPRIPEVGFTHWYRVAQLVPFFYAGMLASPYLRVGARRGETVVILVGMPVYAALYLLFHRLYGGFQDSFYPAFGSVPSVLLWIAMAVAGSSAYIAAIRFLVLRGYAPGLAYFGANSVYLFLLHTPILLVEWRLLRVIAGIPGVPDRFLSSPAFTLFILFPVTVSLSLGMKALMLRLGMGFFFRRPAWLRLP